MCEINRAKPWIEKRILKIKRFNAFEVQIFQIFSASDTSNYYLLQIFHYIIVLILKISVFSLYIQKMYENFLSLDV